MALINCPECQKEISDKVKICIHCGYPLISEHSNDNTPKMPIITCPECKKEISDKDKACPHCGYPLVSESASDITQNVEVTDTTKIIATTDKTQKVEAAGTSKKSKKTKPIIIGAIAAAIVVVIGIFVGLFIYKRISENTYLTNLENTKKTYLRNLRTIGQKMWDGYSIAFDLTKLTHDVWYNTIYEKSSPETDKFTKTGRKFNDDFNTSLRLLSQDADVKSKEAKLEIIQGEVMGLMGLLNDPPEELRNAYNDLDKTYRSFNNFVDLAIMRGNHSYNSFSSKRDECLSELEGNLRKLATY
jgi:RNA polymerase subunit RPABC4/transcription elongation factor Spt4